MKIKTKQQQNKKVNAKILAIAGARTVCLQSELEGW